MGARHSGSKCGPGEGISVANQARILLCSFPEATECTSQTGRPERTNRVAPYCSLQSSRQSLRECRKGGRTGRSPGTCNAPKGRSRRFCKSYSINSASERERRSCAWPLRRLLGILGKLQGEHNAAPRTRQADSFHSPNHFSKSAALKFASTGFLNEGAN